MFINFTVALICIFVTGSFIILAKLLFPHHITPKELAIQIGVSLVISLASSVIASDLLVSATDYEVINGTVAKKEPVQWQCPMFDTQIKDDHCEVYRIIYKSRQECSTDTKGRRSCHTVTDTYYRYTYPWEQDWFVYSDQEWMDEDSYVKIPRVDERGLNAPERWQQAIIGEPMALYHEYQNWLLASADTLFKDYAPEEKLQAYSKYLPEQNKIYDFYRYNHIVNLTGDSADYNLMNTALRTFMQVYGPKYQFNPIVIVAHDLPSDYMNVLLAYWKGFRKNEAVIALSLDDAGNLKSADVRSWSKDNFFDINLRNDLNAYVGKKVTTKEFMAAMMNSGDHFKRRPMADFEYLKYDVKPSYLFIFLTVLMLIVINSAVVCVLLYTDIN